MSRRFSLFGACLLCLLLSACGGKSTRPDVVQPDVPEAVRVTPLETPGVFPVSEAEAQRLSRGLAPARQGMRSWKDMRFAVEQSLAYVRAKPSSRVAVNYPALQVTYGEMEKGLERLLRLLPFLDKAPEVLPTSVGFASARTSASPAITSRRSRRPTSARGVSNTLSTNPLRICAKSALITPVTPSTARAR